MTPISVLAIAEHLRKGGAIAHGLVSGLLIRSPKGSDVIEWYHDEDFLGAIVPDSMKMENGVLTIAGFDPDNAAWVVSHVDHLRIEPLETAREEAVGASSTAATELMMASLDSRVRESLDAGDRVILTCGLLDGCGGEICGFLVDVLQDGLVLSVTRGIEPSAKVVIPAEALEWASVGIVKRNEEIS